MYSQYPLTPYGTLPCIFSFKRGGILPLGWGLDDALFVGCVCAWLAEVSIRHCYESFRKCWFPSPEEAGWAWPIWTRIVSSCGTRKDAGKTKINVAYTLEGCIIIAGLLSLRVRWILMILKLGSYSNREKFACDTILRCDSEIMCNTSRNSMRL